jgi:hypothetical protein
MSLITLLIVVLVVCLICWLISRAPIPPPFNWIVPLVLAIILLFWLFSVVGFPAGLRLR